MGKRKTDDEFKQEMSNLVGDEYLVLGQYQNGKTKMTFIHNIQDCQYQFDMRPSCFLEGAKVS